MQNNQKYTPVRFSHLTSYSGVGAIVRGAEGLLMVMADTRYWKDKDGQNITTEIPYVKRITQALNLSKELRMPPVAQEISHKGKKDIEGNYLPAVLFPTYAICQKCGLLHPNPWSNQNKKLDEKVYCQGQGKNCGGSLTQVTWCCVSSEGHLDDVPWHYLCHQKFKNICKNDYSANYLKLTANSNGKKIIKCTKCNNSRVYEKGILGFVSKPQPWIYEQAELGKGSKVIVVEVNDSATYLPERVNALVIPPESRISKNTLVDKLYNNSVVLGNLEKIKNARPRFGKQNKTNKFDSYTSDYKCTEAEIEDALEQINNGYPNFDKVSTTNNLILDEYQAFLTPLKNICNDEDFITEHKTIEWKRLQKEVDENNLSALIKLVDNQIIAKRLREILVFKGFKRGHQEGQEQSLTPPDITGKSDWLPAIELFGEGMFFTLDDDILSKWEAIPAVKKRADEISQRYKKSSLNLGNNVIISPMFILLHTLSHLIMRELEAIAGYPSASLSERIYHNKAEKMAGILIYTAVPDVVGSLGGIVESAQPKEFLKILSGAFKHAKWCSLDPVCTEHNGQGPGWLNRAACHGCVLVPEKACEYGNVFLDRVFIKGDGDEIPDFLNFVSDYNNG